VKRNPFMLVMLALAFATTGLAAQAPTDSVIRIELSKAKVFRADRPITRVAIANEAIADVTLITPTQVLLVARKEIGTTSLILWHGDEEAETHEVAVLVPGEMRDKIKAKIEALAPSAKVNVSMGTNSIILDGQVESLEALERTLQIAKGFVPQVTNLITVKGSQQVQIKVTIAEVSRTAMKRMGLAFLNNRDWGVAVLPSGTAEATMGLSRTRGAARNVSGGTTEVTGAIDSTSELASVAEVPSPFAAAFQVVLQSLHDDSLAILSLLKSQGLARTLASPTLVTMSGQEAEFLVGGEFPIPVAGANGQTSVQFRQYGIRLKFTPTVVGKETITLHVEPEVSTPDFALGTMSGGVAVPGLTTRRSSATLQLKDGQTFAMAGLLKEETAEVQNKVPFLGDLPLLGSLFTSKEYRRNETELVIIVTPRLVRALNEGEVPPLPGAAMGGDEGDVNFFLLNRSALQRTKGARRRGDAAPAFVGPSGFDR